MIEGVEQNGRPKELVPAIIAAWDEEHHIPLIQTNMDVLKNLNFAISFVDMIKRSLEAKMKEMQVAEMQQKMVNQQQTSMIARRVQKDLRGGL